MSQPCGSADEHESIATIHRAIELGIFFLDTANVYGDGHNERLVGRAIADRRDKVILATKFGLMRDDDSRSINGHPAYVKACCDALLARLGVEYIDLYYLKWERSQHRRFFPNFCHAENVLFGLTSNSRTGEGQSSADNSVQRESHLDHIAPPMILPRMGVILMNFPGKHME